MKTDAGISSRDVAGQTRSCPSKPFETARFVWRPFLHRLPPDTVIDNIPNDVSGSAFEFCIHVSQVFGQNGHAGELNTTKKHRHQQNGGKAGGRAIDKVRNQIEGCGEDCQRDDSNSECGNIGQWPFTERKDGEQRPSDISHQRVCRTTIKPGVAYILHHWSLYFFPECKTCRQSLQSWR